MFSYKTILDKFFTKVSNVLLELKTAAKSIYI